MKQKFKIAMKQGDRDFTEVVTGHTIKIEGIEDFQFFTHRDVWGHHISELKTGRSISSNLFSLELAIKEAKKKIKNNWETFREHAENPKNHINTTTP